jgi:hypothetical protein
MSALLREQNAQSAVPHFDAALKLYRYLLANHWDDQALMGPDVGIRFNYRIGRFVKGYLRGMSWDDTYYYLQAQSYWILGNWRLLDITREEMHRDIALHCATCMIRQQRPDGAWDYPNREWKGRIATAEGTWGALGLLETYNRTSDPVFLESVLKWHKYLVEMVGFQRVDNDLAVNYFAHRAGARVPNNSAFVLRFLAELASATSDETYLQRCVDLLAFMQHAQKPTGEFPYTVAGASSGKDRPHFQCYQYNAFQCLDLIRYYEVTRDPATLPLVGKVLKFLSTGLAEDGYALYECGSRYRTVTYHTAVLGAAFAKAGHIGIEGYEELATRAYTHLLSIQRPDGSFAHSQREYLLLSDQRSYPRNLAMIMYHLLVYLEPTQPHHIKQTVDSKEVV